MSIVTARRQAFTAVDALLPTPHTPQDVTTVGENIFYGGMAPGGVLIAHHLSPRA